MSPRLSRPQRSADADSLVSAVDHRTTNPPTQSEPTQVARESLTESQAEQHFGVDITSRRQLAELQRLEQIHGRKVHEWLAEGMPREAMGIPSKMRAFRRRTATTAENAEENEEQPVQRSTKATADKSQTAKTDVPESVREVVSSTGHSLDESLKRTMEAELSDSFDEVQIHTGATAAEACESINARAFTVGNHIAFNRGEYDPSSRAGQHVIAHELAHVRQQTRGPISRFPQHGVDMEVDPDPQVERQAESTARRVLQTNQGGSPQPRDTGLQIQRMPTPRDQLTTDPTAPDTLPPGLERHSEPTLERADTEDREQPRLTAASTRTNASAPADLEMGRQATSPDHSATRHGGSPPRADDEEITVHTDPVDPLRDRPRYHIPEQENRDVNETEAEIIQSFASCFLGSSNQTGMLRALQRHLLADSDGVVNFPTLNAMYTDLLRQEESQSRDDRYLAALSTGANASVGAVINNILVNGIAGADGVSATAPLSYQGIGASAVGIITGDYLIKSIIQCEKCKHTNSYFINSSSLGATITAGCGYVFRNLHDAQTEHQDQQQQADAGQRSQEDVENLGNIWWEMLQHNVPVHTFLGAGLGTIGGQILAHIIRQKTKSERFDENKDPYPSRVRSRDIMWCECENCTHQWNMLDHIADATLITQLTNTIEEFLQWCDRRDSHHE